MRSIVVLSKSGATARLVAAARPAALVIVVTGDAGVCRRANLLWGTVPVHTEPGDLEQPQAIARHVVQDLGLAAEGQYILSVAGFKPTATDAAPMITALQV